MFLCGEGEIDSYCVKLVVQVPSPLTDDMELARKEKMNEKKKAQKKAKKLKEVMC